MRRPTLTAYSAVRALLLAILAIVVFANSWGVFNTDIKPEIYLAPGQMLERYLSAWTDSPYLGSPNFNVGLMPVLVVTAFLRALGLDPEMAFKVYHLAIWVVGAWGASRLLRSLVPTASRWAGLIAGAAYIANPYTISAGSTLAIALPLALLPWMLLALARALREPRSWAWPAGFGLAFFAMSGMNVAVVPVFQLLLILPVVIIVRREQDLSWGRVVRVVGRCAAFVILLSLYWLVPAVAATATGGQIVEGSETLEGIAKVSSFSEVLRGVGMWAIYGRSDTGPWVPEFAAYVASPIFILLTTLWPVAALASLRWVPRHLERVMAVTIAVVAVIMVGLFPASGSSPFGWLLGQAFEHIPSLIAFRTTNKIGAGLALFFALAIGLASVRVVPRVMRMPGIAPVAVATAFITLFAWTAPAFTNNLYISSVDVPDYWRAAADQVDKGNPDSRVLLLPGQVRSSYRWSPERPDDMPNSLFSRDAVIPETTPNASAPGANFLAALDDTVQSSDRPGDSVSVYARYLGADNVLLRHDVRFEGAGGARPGVTAAALSEDRGLSGIANFGRPGENTLPPTIQPSIEGEGILPPLQLYGVGQARTTVNAASTDNQYVVAGDGWSVASMSAAGLLRGAPTFRYAHDMDAEDLRAALRSSASRMVLTDTNQRREAITNRLTANQGAPLRADEQTEITRTLGDNPDDQSVLVTDGVQVSATQQGGAFFDLPYGSPENAVDGDPTTSWLFGDFRGAVGQSLTMDLPSERELGTTRISPTALGDVEIGEVEITAGDVTEKVTMPASGPATVDLGGVRADKVTLKITSVRGEGYSLVGISEIDLGSTDLRAERAVRTPRTLTTLYTELTQREREGFADVPLDVLLRRGTNTADTGDDTERRLSRDFSLPDDRTFDATAHIRVDGRVEPVYDRLLGQPSRYSFTSSGYDFYNPKLRASQAADGSRGSAWAPTQEMQDSWWQVKGPERDIPRVVIDQRSAETGPDETQFAGEVAISVDGSEVAREAVERGTTTITLPEGTRGKTVRMTITKVTGRLQGRPARFTTIDTGSDARMTPRSGDDRPCLSVATLDGEPLRMRPVQSRAPLAGAGSSGTAWEACETLRVAWGEHEIRPVGDFQLDDLTLRDRQGKDVAPGKPAPVLKTSRDLDRGLTVEAGRSAGPYVLSIGQSFDPRWRASMDGKDLGDPIVVDGYATGWVIDNPGAHTVHVDFGPQRWANIALLISLAGVLLSLALLFRAVRRRADDEEPATDDDDDSAEPPITEDETSSVAASEKPGDASAGSQPSRRARGPLAQALRRRETAEVGFVLAAGFLAGIGGLVGGLLAVGLARWSRTSPATLILGGALVVLLASAVYVFLGRDVFPMVDATVVSRSLIPHHVAAAGLSLAVAGALWRATGATDRKDRHVDVRQQP